MTTSTAARRPACPYGVRIRSMRIPRRHCRPTFRHNHRRSKATKAKPIGLFSRNIVARGFMGHPKHAVSISVQSGPDPLARHRRTVPCWCCWTTPRGSALQVPALRRSWRPPHQNDSPGWSTYSVMRGSTHSRAFQGSGIQGQPWICSSSPKNDPTKTLYIHSYPKAVLQPR